MSSVDQTNGFAEGAELLEQDRTIALELTFPEAHALRGWLLNSTNNGSTAVEDGEVKAVLVKLGTKVDAAEAVSTVRAELDRMGLQSDHLNDEEILEFGRRISSQSSVQRLS